ncbi:MAG: tetratricopeptide repeat protein [Candidatus Heimdallarchaeota archaeon]|nr:tetratricopeptide repeat protein [Candidatus Heimdallarchaeota archaeon]MCK4612952.1 tetratricopeptide repeat protein [Candidatus Heimdallarchaeota archaeon]
MVITKSQEIKEIEELKLSGKYYEALERIEEILKKKEKSIVEKIQIKILKSEILYYLGSFERYREKHEEGLKISSEALVESEKLGEMVLVFDSLYWKNLNLFYLDRHKEFVEGGNRLEEIILKLEGEDYSILSEKKAYLSLSKSTVGLGKSMYVENYKWNIQESIEILEKGVKEAKNTENIEILMILFYILAWRYDVKGNFDKAIEFNNKALEVAEELGNGYWKGRLLGNIGWNYRGKGEYGSLLEYAKKSLEVREKIGNERFLAQSYAQIGVFYGETGEWKEALEYAQKAHNILTENGKRGDEPGILSNIAVYYRQLGEIDKALEYLEKLYEIQKKIEDIYGSYVTLGNIAGIYFHKGEIDKALELEEQVLDFYERMGEKFRIAENLSFISLIYSRKGAFNKALEYLEKALEIYLEIGNKSMLADTCYNFIVLATKYDKMDLAKEYYKKLEEIIEEIEHKNVKLLILIAEGIILKRSSESRDRDRAEVLFDQLLQEDIGPYHTKEVLLQLSELLLTELKETSNKRYLTKLQKNISKLIEIGTENNFPLIIVESLWFKSQLSLLNLDIDKARELLSQALDIAERKGLNRLALKITNSKEQMIRQKIELEELEKESPTISRRMEIVKVENGFKELKQKEIFKFKIEKVETSKKLFSLQI